MEENKEAITPVTEENEMDETQVSEVHSEEVTTEESKPLTRREKKKAWKQEKYKKILEYGPGHDIKYRGPLGIRGLRITAWILMMLSAASISISIAYSVGAVSQNYQQAWNALAMIASVVGALAIPSFMLAKFAMIFQKNKKPKDMIITYGALVLIILAVFLLAYFHYGVHFIEVWLGVGYQEASENLAELLTSRVSQKISFNVFMDMFLWSCYFACIEYEIKDKKTWKVILKWVLTFLPFIYVCVWFALKVLFSAGMITIPVGLLPIIPTSTPVIFLAFIVISLFIKRRKKLYMRIGGTEEGYQAYLKTNANSFHFARIASACFFGAGVIDFIVSVVFYALAEIPGYEWFSNLVTATGIGSASAYILFAPFILLFCYTKPFKNDKFDLIITMAAIVIIILIVFEGAYYSLLKFVQAVKDSFSS